MARILEAPELNLADELFLKYAGGARRAATASLWPGALAVADQLGDKPNLLRRVPAAWIEHILALVPRDTAETAVAGDRRRAASDALRRSASRIDAGEMAHALFTTTAPSAWLDALEAACARGVSGEAVAEAAGILLNLSFGLDGVDERDQNQLLDAVTDDRWNLGRTLRQRLLTYVSRVCHTSSLCDWLLGLRAWGPSHVHLAAAIRVIRATRISQPLPPLTEEAKALVRDLFSARVGTNGLFGYNAMDGMMRAATGDLGLLASWPVDSLDDVATAAVLYDDGPDGALRDTFIGFFHQPLTSRWRTLDDWERAKPLLDCWAGTDAYTLVTRRLGGAALVAWAATIDDTKMAGWARSKLVDDVTNPLGDEGATGRRLARALLLHAPGVAAAARRRYYGENGIATLLELAREMLGTDEASWSLAFQLLDSDTAFADVAAAAKTLAEGPGKHTGGASGPHGDESAEAP